MPAPQLSASSSLLDHFQDLEDPRMDRRKAHPLLNVVFIAICAVLSGAEGWRSIETFGEAKQQWFAQFLQLPDGKHPVPSDDTYRRTISRLDPEAFETAFRRWVASVARRIDGDVLALDGKALRDSCDRDGEVWQADGTPGGMPQEPLHLVSAWATEQRHGAASGSGPRSGRREDQRDHRSSRFARGVGGRGGPGDHRCDGHANTHRRANHRSRPDGSPRPGRAQYFPSSASFKTSLSRERSATSFFRRLFSFARSLSRMSWTSVHRAVLALPSVGGLFGDIDVANRVRDGAAVGPSSLNLAELRDNPIRGVTSLFLHGRSGWVGAPDQRTQWISFWIAPDP